MFSDYIEAKRVALSAQKLYDDVVSEAELLTRITLDPDICHGKPCIRGLRYPVETLLELLSSGMSSDEILEDYEDLESEDLRATLAYAAKLSRVNRAIPLA